MNFDEVINETGGNYKKNSSKDYYNDLARVRANLAEKDPEAINIAAKEFSKRNDCNENQVKDVLINKGNANPESLKDVAVKSTQNSFKKMSYRHKERDQQDLINLKAFGNKEGPKNNLKPGGAEYTGNPSKKEYYSSQDKKINVKSTEKSLSAISIDQKLKLPSGVQIAISLKNYGSTSSLEHIRSEFERFNNRPKMSKRTKELYTGDIAIPIVVIDIEVSKSNQGSVSSIINAHRQKHTTVYVNKDHSDEVVIYGLYDSAGFAKLIKDISDKVGFSRYDYSVFTEEVNDSEKENIEQFAKDLNSLATKMEANHFNGASIVRNCANSVMAKVKQFFANIGNKIKSLFRPKEKQAISARANPANAAAQSNALNKVN